METRLTVTTWYGEHAGGLGDHRVIVAAGDGDTDAAGWRSEPLVFLEDADPYDPVVKATVTDMVLERKAEAAWPADADAPRLDPYVVYDDDGDEIEETRKPRAAGDADRRGKPR